MNIIVGSAENGVSIFEVTVNEEGQLSHKLNFRSMYHNSAVTDLSSGEKYVASAAKNSTICLFDLKNNVMTATYQEGEGSVNCVKIANNNHLVCAGDDGCLRVFETKKMGDLFYTFPSQEGSISSLALHPSSKVCLTVNPQTGFVFTWDMIAGRKCFVKSFKQLKPSIVRWSPTGSHFIVSSNKKAQVLDVKTTECVCELNFSKWVQCLEFVKCGDADVIVSGDNDGYLTFFDIQGKTLSKFKAHEGRVKGLHVLPCQQFSKVAKYEQSDLFICTGSTDSFLKVWHVSSSSLVEKSESANTAKCLFKHKLLSNGTTPIRITCLTSWTAKQEE